MATHQSIENDYKLPPQNLEAEESILSACIIDSVYAKDAFDILTPSDFYRTVHQKIFQVILDLHNSQEPIDIVTIKSELEKNSLLEDIGGAQYLSKMIGEIPMATNIQHYCGLIKSESVKRKIIERCHKTIEQCYLRGHVTSIIDNMHSSFLKINYNGNMDHAVTLKEKTLEALEIYEERQENKKLFTGVVSGYSDLDYITRGFQSSDLIVLAARPSMGKTALVWEMLRNAAKAGNTGLIFSLEMSCQQLMDRAFASESGVSCQLLRAGGFSNEHWVKLGEAGSRLYELNILIDDSGGLNHQEIRRRARNYKKRHDIDIVVIDHLQLVHGEKSRSRNDEIGSITHSFKEMAKELKIPVILLSQLSRKVEERKNHRPVLSDLRDSGNIEQDADVVCFIYRPGFYGLDEKFEGYTELIIEKHRNGPTGKILLKWQDKITRFYSVERE